MNMQRNNAPGTAIYALSPPSPSESSHNILNQLHQQQQQQHSPLVKTELEYDCIDEQQPVETSGSAGLHNYRPKQQQQQLHLSDDHPQPLHIQRSIYHNSGGGGGGGGVAGGGSDSENNIKVTSSHQRSTSTAGGGGSSLSASPTSWNQPIQIIQRSQQQQQQQHIAQQQQPHNIAPCNAHGVLSHESQILYITETCTEIGRNSSTSSVHFHVAKNSFVSRKHMKIIFDEQSGDFFLICLSKNGVFIDDMFQRRSTEAMKLPKGGCTFRFPSTEIRITFESFSQKMLISGGTASGGSDGIVSGGGGLIGSSGGGGGGSGGGLSDTAKSNFKTVENSNVIYSPLKITIPKTEQKSPFPSPTGTISAANSCPTSPRGFQEYPTYHYNNNNNFQNGLFPPPPSTSTTNEHEKPPYSYAQLIVQSISAAPDKQLTLSGIYSFISKHYPYYRKEANKGWQNSIRHNLSLNRYFIKVARSQDEPGKGSFWRIDPNSEAKLIDQSYKKRRQRGSQCFRPPYGMPRSAPVSPSHIDNSRENSPLRDIVLQSAPGSPGVSYQNSHSEHQGNEDNSYGSQHLVQSSSYSGTMGNSSTTTNNYYTTSSSTSSQHHQSSLKRHQTSSSSSSSSSNIHHGGGGGGGGGGGASNNNLNNNNNNNSNSSATAAITISTASTTHQQPDDMYDDIPDYNASGADSGDEMAEQTKRQKYATASDDINQ